MGLKSRYFTIKSGEKLFVREAEKKDAADLIEYVNEVAAESDFLTMGPGDFKKTMKEEEKIISEHRRADNMVFLVAELDGEIAGILNVNANRKPRTRHIGDFGVTVRKKYWGSGIGSRLMEVMLKWAKNTGVIRKINLSVQSNNKAAIALYKKFGFKKEGIIRRDSWVNGKFYDSYAMGIFID